MTPETDADRLHKEANECREFAASAVTRSTSKLGGIGAPSSDPAARFDAGRMMLEEGPAAEGRSFRSSLRIET
jgi:hypothetical protein